MNDQNISLFTGRLTREVEVKELSGGTQVANFSIAVNKNWKKDGEAKSKVVFVDLDVWGPQINFVSNYLHKGDLVGVETEYAPNTTETEDGRRTYPKFVVREVRKLSWDKREAAPAEEEAAPPKTEDKPKRGRKNKDIVVDDSMDGDIPF